SQEEMSREMADLGMEVYSSASEDYAEFSLSSASRVRKDALRIFCEILEKPAFSQGEIERLRTETLTDISSIGDDGFTLTSCEFKRVLYGAHPYGRLILGDAESVGRFSVDGLRAFHERAYRGPNILLAIAGDAEAVEVERDLNALTAKWRNDPCDFTIPET